MLSLSALFTPYLNSCDFENHLFYISVYFELPFETRYVLLIFNSFCYLLNAYFKMCYNDDIFIILVFIILISFSLQLNFFQENGDHSQLNCLVNMYLQNIVIMKDNYLSSIVIQNVDIITLMKKING